MNADAALYRIVLYERGGKKYLARFWTGKRVFWTLIKEDGLLFTYDAADRTMAGLIRVGQCWSGVRIVTERVGA